ncbi:hypothetical protein ES288_D02G057900v1 [Gossypium darwinii]|uniref:Uncharacterized protein n=1 Tax=Gossypium darwinii TaxID=34276 RepID=A0A5D2D9J9_GOSDA|nr:hypothetical protein ES288_D02G057900v1 [Gossypium darwinii]
MTSLLSGSKVIPECCSQSPLLISLIIFLRKLPKSYKNASKFSHFSDPDLKIQPSNHCVSLTIAYSRYGELLHRSDFSNGS